MGKKRMIMEKIEKVPPHRGSVILTPHRHRLLASTLVPVMPPATPYPWTGSRPRHGLTELVITTPATEARA
ncbi:MAG: hypothetical protein KIS96_14380 [Bauldia sp.]|nr:hypothetical protein [Bauldia sp.]